MEEKEQEQVKTQQVKTKKKVNQSTLVYVVIIFILIIALMVVSYFAFLRKDDTTVGNTTTNNTLNNTTVNTVIDNNVTSNAEKTNTVNTENKTSQEKGEELKISNRDVQKILEKFNFSSSNVISSIYKIGEFNKTDIPNQLVLKLGWYKLDNEKTTKDYENLRETVDAKVLKDSIYSVFGKDIKYQDRAFKYGNVDIFTAYAIEDINYNTNTDKYEATIFQGGGGDIPFIHEEFSKAIKRDNEIKIYVKTAFVDSTWVDNNDFVYDIYSDYNFRKETFENKLYTTNATEFYKNYNYTNKLTENVNGEIGKIIDKLDTYVYTFTLDKDSGEYYFTAFNKE